MMRQIKFRGKDKRTGEWFYGNLFDKDTSGRTHISTTRQGCLDIDPETVGQFTGQLDKNGKEIYEGDIVKAPLLDPIFGDILSDAFCNAVIEFNNGAFVVSYYGCRKIYIQDLHNKVEVIGNIHDNPELLNEK